MANTEYYRKVFSENLKRVMEARRKTQTDIINDLKLNKSAVSTWVNGTRLPRMDKVDLLADYLRVNRSDLIEDHSQSSEPLSSSTALNEPEEKLLTHYRNLNEEGQEKLVEYAEDLEASGRYIKNNEFDILQEEDA